MNSKLIFIVFICLILAYGTFFPILSFSLSWDDWFLYWGSKYDIPYLSRFQYWLYPETMIEFLVLSRLISWDSSIWIHIGIILKVVSALSAAYLSKTLFKSDQAAVISAIFLSVTLIGTDATLQSGAHVHLVVITFLCMSLSYWIKYLEQGLGKTFRYSAGFFVLALLSDPFRTVPVIPVYYLLTYAGFGTKKHSLGVASFLKKIFFILIVCGFILIFIYQKLIQGIFIRYEFLDLNPISESRYIIFHFFSTLGSLATGWVYPLPDGGLRFANRINYVIGFVLFMLGVSKLYYGITAKNQKSVLTGSLISWMVLAYGINWLYEPRLLVNPTHRYITISSVGFFILLGFYLNRIKNRLVVITAFTAIALLNIYNSQKFYIKQSSYRTISTVKSVWNYIDDSVPKHEKSVILYLTGNEPYVTNIFLLTGGYPYTLKRNISTVMDRPEVTFEYTYVVERLCSISPDGRSRDKTLNDVYAFSIIDSAKVENITLPIRTDIRKDLRKLNCPEITNNYQPGIERTYT